MPLVLDIELISGRYDAAGAGDREAPEWPPHPARVFCALVAGARSDAEREVLRWLEQLPPPVVQAAATTSTDVRSSYVVTNAVEKDGGSQFHPARTNALRRRHSSIPTNARVRIVWSAADVDARAAEALDGLARRVPYLGRSTGVAVLSFSVTLADQPPEGLSEFVPTTNRLHAPALRVPYPGYLDLLTKQYENDRPAWEVGRDIGYRLVDVEATSTETAVAPSMYPDVIILRFAGLRPEGRLTTLFTEALRRAVMAATQDPLPEALHGHGADGRPHVAFLALPNADNAHADGHLMGMAVALPALPEDERRAIVRGVLVGMRSTGDVVVSGPRVLRLRVPRVGEVDLTYEPGLVRPWGIRSERWRRGSDHWVSVTPVVLDRYPRKGDIADGIASSCELVGLPRPCDVVVSTAPLVTGGIPMRPCDLPEQARGKLFRHVELRFDQRVTGPVLVGAGRYLGVGLFAPLGPVAAGIEVDS